jgi:predicted metal-binding membrane protein
VNTADNSAAAALFTLMCLGAMLPVALGVQRALDWIADRRHRATERNLQVHAGIYRNVTVIDREGARR